MRYFFDNNLSIHLAQAIAALCAADQVEVVHLRKKFSPNVTDLEWINALAEDGDWCVVTQDRLITKNPLEKEALRQSGLIVFVLAQGWANQGHWEKSAKLVRWWPRIMEQARLVRGGALFKVPWRVSGRGKFEPLRL